MSAHSLQLIVDGRPLVGNRTGIGVHTAEIAGRLQYANPPLLASHAPIDDRTGLEMCRFRVDERPLGVLWQQLDLPSVARQEKADVLWGPHGTLPWTIDTPSVVTVHDLSSLTMSGAHRIKTVLSFNLFISRSLQRASRIAAVSRQTADELMGTFSISAEKIEVIPNGVADYFVPSKEDEALPEGLTSGSYILNVGTMEPRKGIDILLAAWESLDAPRPPLVLTGDRGWGNQRLRRQLDKSAGTGQIILTGYVDRQTLRALYRNCLFFVYPSRFEGFGLPPLEAMACGAAVIATRTGAVEEFAGDAALIIDSDSASLAIGMRKLTTDPGLRSELAVRAQHRAGLYRWDRSAQRMKELFDAAAQ